MFAKQARRAGIIRDKQARPSSATAAIVKLRSQRIGTIISGASTHHEPSGATIHGAAPTQAAGEPEDEDQQRTQRQRRRHATTIHRVHGILKGGDRRRIVSFRFRQMRLSAAAIRSSRRPAVYDRPQRDDRQHDAARPTSADACCQDAGARPKPQRRQGGKKHPLLLAMGPQKSLATPAAFPTART